MSEDSIVAIVVALLAGGGLWTFMAALIPKKEAPIKKADAETVAAHTSQQMTLELLHDVQKELRETRENADREYRARLSLESKVQGLQANLEADRQELGLLRQAVEVLVGGWRDIQERWEELRRRPDPPALPHFRIPPRRGSTATHEQ